MGESRFDGRVAIVTGASSGIGRAVAERLSTEGASLLLLAAPSDQQDLDATVRELQAKGSRVRGLADDVADPQTAARATELAIDEYGRLDVLVNNAGFSYLEEFLSAPIEHLDRMLAVNVRGTYLMSQAAARLMAVVGSGAITMTASTASYLGEEFNVAYNASKAAVAAMARSMAVDLAPTGVRVNAVAPGWVETRATTPVRDDPVQWSKHRSRIPLDRAATPSEVAAVHAFLASDDASYVTGAVVTCDGGLTAGLRYSNWMAVEPPENGLTLGRPDVPVILGRPAEL